VFSIPSANAAVSGTSHSLVIYRCKLEQLFCRFLSVFLAPPLCVEWIHPAAWNCNQLSIFSCYTSCGVMGNDECPHSAGVYTTLMINNFNIMRVSMCNLSHKAPVRDSSWTQQFCMVAAVLFVITELQILLPVASELRPGSLRGGSEMQ
jgi:hypothetical protein